MGYVGLPTALALTDTTDVIGLDIDEQHIAALSEGNADIDEDFRGKLAEVLDAGRLQLVSDWDEVGDFSGAVVCVPTPIDEQRRPDPTALCSACASLVENARPGQTLVLTSTTYVGSTRQLLADPLAQRGLNCGEDIHVAFSPERITPGTDDMRVPRILGGITPACTQAALELIAPTAQSLHPVSAPEVAELSKLFENSFRAVNLSLANELADICTHLDLDVNEVIEAASTKPYAFMAHYPSAGVGGHCIPVDPHYLYQPMTDEGVEPAIIGQALEQIAERPEKLARRAIEMLDRKRPARVLVEGATYKPGIKDARHSPGRDIAHQLRTIGKGNIDVYLHDPLLHETESPQEPESYDVVVVAVTHPGYDYSWLGQAPRVLDCTYSLEVGERP